MSHGRILGERSSCVGFLQKVTSNNVAALVSGKIQYTCFPNEDGVSLMTYWSINMNRKNIFGC